MQYMCFTKSIIDVCSAQGAPIIIEDKYILYFQQTNEPLAFKSRMMRVTGGFMRKTTAPGIFALLPLGQRVLRKVDDSFVDVWFPRTKIISIIGNVCHGLHPVQLETLVENEMVRMHSSLITRPFKQYWTNIGF